MCLPHWTSPSVVGFRLSAIRLAVTLLAWAVVGPARVSAGDLPPPEVPSVSSASFPMRDFQHDSQMQETPYDASLRPTQLAGGHWEWGHAQTLLRGSVRETPGMHALLSQKRLTVSWSPALGPAVQLAYVHGTRSEGPAHQLPTSQSDGIESSFTYRLAAVLVHARSAYVQDHQTLAASAITTRQEHSVTASYPLVPTLTLSSQLSFQEEGSAQTPSTSVALSYRPLRSLQWHVSSRYSVTRGVLDTTLMQATSTVSWAYGHSASLTLEQSYTAALNQRCAETFATLVQLRLAGEPWVQAIRELLPF